LWTGDETDSKGNEESMKMPFIRFFIFHLQCDQLRRSSSAFICGGGETKGNGEVSLDMQAGNVNSEEVVKAKSASRIQSKWKRVKLGILTVTEMKKQLDEKSHKDNEIVSIETMRSKISPKVQELERSLPPFTKEPEIRAFRLSFERDPIMLNDGSIYQGQWNEKGFRHGYGTLIRSDGSKYEGFFSNDEINGRGRYIDSQGTFHYEGLFKNNKANGKGSYFLSDGTKYIGDWEDDLQQGYGEDITPDGTVYVGQFKDGEKNGKGKVTWTDGSTFEGDFVNGMIHGYGVYKWSDKREYKGHWMNGKMHGKGIFTWPDGKYYDGEYKNDKKDGFGKYFWDGKCYEGTWFNGKQNGYGSVYFKDEIILKAFWRYGKIIKRDFEKNNNFDNFSVATDNVHKNMPAANVVSNKEDTLRSNNDIAAEEKEKFDSNGNKNQDNIDKM